MLFDPPPTPGSSGGPIVEEESGAVVGIMLGTQMRNRLEGVSGWGAPSELIFEVRCRQVLLRGIADAAATDVQPAWLETQAS